METQQFSNGPWGEYDDDAQTVVRDRDRAAIAALRSDDEAPPPTQRSVEATPSGPARTFSRTMMGPAVANFEAERAAQPDPPRLIAEEPTPVPWIAAPPADLPFRDAPKVGTSSSQLPVVVPPALIGLPVAPVPAGIAAPPRAQVVPAPPPRPVVLQIPSNRPPPPASATPAAMAIDLPTGVRARVSREILGPASLQRPGNRASVMLAAASLLISLALGFVLLTPRSGQLRIAPVLDKGKIERADVYIDGSKRCDAVPCVVSGLSKGEHGVEIRAAGYESQAKIENVDIGKERLALVPLHPAPGAAGFRASAKVAGVHAFVDGVDRGALPVELFDLSPGEHRIRFAGPGFEGTERRVDLPAGDVRDLGVIADETSPEQPLVDDSATK